MKTTLITAFAGLVAISAAAQTIVTLNNNIPGCVRAPVFGPEPGNPSLSKTGNPGFGIPSGGQTYGGALLSGAGYSAQLFYAAGPSPEYELTEAGSATTFRMGSLAGYVTSSSINLPLPVGISATFQVRAWDNASGAYPNWSSAEAAWHAGLITAGRSPTLYIGSLAASNNLCGLLSFNLHSLLPGIIIQPTNQVVLDGQNATFIVNATGLEPLRYQWRFYSNPIPEATNSFLLITDAHLYKAGSYDVVINNNIGSVTSVVATLVICQTNEYSNGFDSTNSAIPWTPWWGSPLPVLSWDAATDAATNPASGSLKLVEPFTGTTGEQFMTSFTFGDRWPWDSGLVLDGRTYSNLVFDLRVQPGTALAIGGNYGWLELGFSGWPFDWATTVPLATYIIPGTATNWTRVVVPINSSSTNLATITGVYFKMQSDGTFTNTLAFNIDNLSVTRAGSPVITSQPTNQTVLVGQNATFTVGAAGLAPLTYQWRFNGSPIPGANNTSCTISSAQLTNSGTYDVVIANPSGSVTSVVASLTVIVAAPPSVTTRPVTYDAIGVVTLHATIIPNGLLTHYWFEWGTTTNYGSASAPVDIGSGAADVLLSHTLAPLTRGLDYHFRAVASNTLGRSYGSDLAFVVADRVVTNLNDGGPGSLREALSMPGEIILLAVTGTITLTNGQLVINDDRTLVGPGATNLAISGNHSSRVFYCSNTQATNRISGLTIRDGHAPDGYQDHTGGEGAGGIANHATLTLTSCIISSNSAGNGAPGTTGISGGPLGGNGSAGSSGGLGGNGGGIYNVGTLTLTGCTLHGNFAGAGGRGGAGGFGGLVSGSGGRGGYGGDGGDGGGLYNYGLVTINNCTFSGNSAGRGGEGGFGGGPPDRPGDGGRGGDGGSGGAIYADAMAYLKNCTVSGNFAAECGPGGPPGGYFGSDGSPGFVGYAGGLYAYAAQLLNTLVALNIGTTNAPDVYGYFLSTGHNLIANTNGAVGFGTNGDVLNIVNPLITPLAFNGGPTPTHALLPGSPALETGDDTVLFAPYSLTTDQRGFPRKVGYHVDIGACEMSEPGISLPGAVSLGATIQATNPLTGGLTVLFNCSLASGGAYLYSGFVEYGLTSTYGGFAGFTNIMGSSPLTLSVSITDLAPGMSFHYRVVSSNVIGRAVSPDQVFVTTPPLLPGDANGDGMVSQAELDTVLAHYWPHSPWLYMTNTAGLGGANVTFALSNSLEGAYSVLVSTNLVDWNYLGPATPRYEFTDTNAPSMPPRYYRLRWP